MRAICFTFLCATIPSAYAQESSRNAPTTSDNTTTMDTIRVTAPRPEVLDLYKFKNPIDPKPTHFDRSMREMPSMEEISMNGGVIPLLVGYMAQKVATGVKKIPGWKDHEQPATARPPPLTEEQMDRAVRLLEPSPTP